VARFAGGRQFMDARGDVFRFITARRAAELHRQRRDRRRQPRPWRASATWGELSAIGVSWWLGDSVSDLVLVPLLLGWTTLRPPTLAGVAWVEASFLWCSWCRSGFVFGDSCRS
jgi:hypothetical protein